MAAADETSNASALRDHTVSPVPSSPSAISSISDIHSVSESGSTFDTTDLQHGQVASSTSMDSKLHPTLKPHWRYYFQDGMVDIAIKDTVFKIPRFIFAQNSVPFSQLIQAHDELNFPESNSIMLRIEDKDVTPVDFERLLEVLYPLKFGEISVTTLDEWSSVLHLASKWSFHTVRDLAIDRLATLASPVDKVFLGRKYDIQEWLVDAYISLCERPEPLTLEEGLRMTMEDVIKISEARHRVRVYYGLVAPDELRVTVRSLFQLSSTESKALESAVGTPKSPSEPPTSQGRPAGPRTSLPVAVDTELPPLDLVRVARLVQALAEHKSVTAQAGLRSMLLPYHAQPDTMAAVLKIVSDQVINHDTRYCKILSNFILFLTEIIDPECTDGSSTGPSGESPSGRSWIVDRLMAHCSTAVDGWSAITDGSWSNVFNVTKFLLTSVEVGLVHDDVFIPLWEAIVRMSERSPAEWAQNMSKFFADDYRRKIQVTSCSLLIDDFYHRVRVCKCEYEEKSPSIRSQEYLILQWLKGLATTRA